MMHFLNDWYYRLKFKLRMYFQNVEILQICVNYDTFFKINLIPTAFYTITKRVFAPGKNDILNLYLCTNYLGKVGLLEAYVYQF